jgi:hypothetical protein
MYRRLFAFCWLPQAAALPWLASACGGATTLPASGLPTSNGEGALLGPTPGTSVASQLLNLALETSAREVDSIGARPTVLSRAHAIAITAIYDAFAICDKDAKGTRLPATTRATVPVNAEFQARAMQQAASRALRALYPQDAVFIAAQLAKAGFRINDNIRGLDSPEGVGNLAADALLAYRAEDNANAGGTAGNGKPYSDTTNYQPVNSVRDIVKVAPSRRAF